MSPRRPELSFSLAWFIRGGLGVGVGGASSACRRIYDAPSRGSCAARRAVVGHPVLRVRPAAVRRSSRLLAVFAGQRRFWCWWKGTWHAPVMAIVHPVVGDSPCGVFCSYLIDKARQDWTPLHQFCDVDVFWVCHGVLQKGVYGVLENRRLLDGPLILPAPFPANLGLCRPGPPAKYLFSGPESPGESFPGAFPSHRRVGGIKSA